MQGDGGEAALQSAPFVACAIEVKSESAFPRSMGGGEGLVSGEHPSTGMYTACECSSSGGPIQMYTPPLQPVTYEVKVPTLVPTSLPSRPTRNTRFTLFGYVCILRP